jgi:putative colanic acid biosynthesis UDP-glucose lipid carrier transferase
MQQLGTLGTNALGRGAGPAVGAAAGTGAPPHSKASIRQTTFRLGTAEPSSLILLRELLGPCVAVLTLALCEWGAGVRFSGQFWALAVIVFLLAQKILTTPELRIGATGRAELQPRVPRLLLEWSCIVAVMLFLLTTLHLMHLIGWLALLTWFLGTPAALLLARSLAFRVARRWPVAYSGSGRHIIIGATETGLELAQRVRQGSYGGEFLGFADFRDPLRLPSLAPGQWIGACAEVVEFVKRNAVDAIYIALPMSSEPRIANLVQQLRDTTASIYLVPANIFDFHLVHPRCLEIHGIPALAVCDTPHVGLSGLGKRIFDLSVGAVALLLLSPLMMLIALCVRLSSPGPVLFKQRRYGLNGEQILVYKFRSMTVCEDGATVTQATRADARTTRLGRFLRRYSLDELPQILNVLEGRMSLVGPRPHAIAHNEQYRKLIGGYMIRHKVRPGITGWAQVNGYRGETQTPEDMRRRVEYDIDYLNSWSLWLDVRILMRTVRVLLNDKHAY